MDLEELLSRDFCELLEHRMSNAWAQAAGRRLSNWWCDGILPPEISMGYSVEQLLKRRQLPARAWLGRDSTTSVFQLTIQLGPQSLQALTYNHPFQDCIPGTTSAAWITLDTEHQLAIVHLL
jgi:hypothetical protein